MDYDEDGVADFLSGANASSQPGFYRVTVNGSESLDLAYVMSSPQAELDGTVAFEFEVPNGAERIPSLARPAEPYDDEEAE